MIPLCDLKQQYLSRTLELDGTTQVVTPASVLDLARDMIHLCGLEVGRDIEIVFTGTRPGEKLYGELQCDGERRLPIGHAPPLHHEARRRAA